MDLLDGAEVPIEAIGRVVLAPDCNKRHPLGAFTP
jgi:hypothetical protein